jgi:hypothetical protein
VGGKLGLSMSLTGLPDLERAFAAYPSKLGTVQKRAILTLLRKLPVQARRDIQAEYSIPAARLRKDLGARVRADGIRLTGYFRGIGLRNFGARQTRAGVTASVFRGARTLRESAFVATMLSGNQQVVQREGEPRVMTKGRYVGKRRQPIVVQYGPTAAQMLRKGRRPERLLDYSRGVLRDEVNRQLKALAGKAGAPEAQ